MRYEGCLVILVMEMLGQDSLQGCLACFDQTLKKRIRGLALSFLAVRGLFTLWKKLDIKYLHRAQRAAKFGLVAVDSLVTQSRQLTEPFFCSLLFDHRLSRWTSELILVLSTGRWAWTYLKKPVIIFEILKRRIRLLKEHVQSGRSLTPHSRSHNSCDTGKEMVHEISGIIANRTPHVNSYDRRQLLGAQQYTGLYHISELQSNGARIGRHLTSTLGLLDTG